MDAGILTTLEGYRELLKANHLSGDDLFKGATCWVLAYNSDTDRHMVAWPEWNLYTSQIELNLAHLDLESLPNAAALPAACRAGNGKLAATFGLKPGSTGIKVFMRIDQEWWNARWPDASGKPKFAEDPDLLSAAINLTFAVIPYDELQDFYCWKPGWSISVRRRRRTLSTYGWLNKTTPETYVIDKAVDLEHRYVEIFHQLV